MEYFGQRGIVYFYILPTLILLRCLSFTCSKRNWVTQSQIHSLDTEETCSTIFGRISSWEISHDLFYTPNTFRPSIYWSLRLTLAKLPTMQLLESSLLFKFKYFKWYYNLQIHCDRKSYNFFCILCALLPIKSQLL